MAYLHSASTTSVAGPKRPVASINDPNAPKAVTGKPQRPSHGPRIKRVKVRAHTRAVKPPRAPAPDPNQNLIDAAVRTRFGPQEQAYGQQLAQNQSYSQGIPTWFANAMQEIQGLQNKGQQSSQQTLQGIQSYNSKPATDAPLDAQAATSRNNLNAQFAAMFGRDQQANSDFMDRMRAAYAAQQNNALSGAATDRAHLLAGQTNLKGQEGDFRTTYGSQLSAAQQKALSDQDKINLARRALGLKVQTYKNVQVPLAKSLAGDRTQKQKVARTKVRQTGKQNAIKNAQWANDQALKAWKLAHPNAGKGPKGSSDFTPTQVRGAHKDFRKALTLLSPATVKADPSGALKALTAPKNAKNPAGGQDPLVAHAIVQTLAYGGVDRKTAEAYYRAYGIHLHVRPTISGKKVVKVIANLPQTIKTLNAEGK